MASKSYLIAHKNIQETYNKYRNAPSNWKEHWWDAVEIIFDSDVAFASEYVIDRKAHTLTKVATQIFKTKTNRQKKDVIVSFLRDESNDIYGTNKIYLFNFSETEHLFSKIGTTARTCAKRLDEEILQYLKTYDITKVYIERIYSTTLPPEGFESFARAMLIKKYPNAFQANDRFFCKVTVEEFDNLWNMYQNISTDF